MIHRIWEAGMKTLGLIVASSIGIASAAAHAATCSSLTKPRLFAQTTIASAKDVPADAAKNIPAHCEVTGTVAPEKDSRIGVVYRLPQPQSWNGKLLGLGGGGFSGNPVLE